MMSCRLCISDPGPEDAKLRTLEPKSLEAYNSGILPGNECMVLI